ncbi:transmembrane channel-like protein [Elysia marginata]|uniref:Transmembrane channel-like protein n=1 Tax=Elysia marginata TaxID=1093978 RepID=A0AAV4JB00_9GAST|nr:transmembrane channel-like protein [Elysia marginata]
MMNPYRSEDRQSSVELGQSEQLKSSEHDKTPQQEVVSGEDCLDRCISESTKVSLHAVIGSLKIQRGDNTDGMNERGESSMPLSVFSSDQKFTSAGAKPEESFRLVNEELHSMFSAPDATFTRRLAKKNPSAPAGSLAFDTAKLIADDLLLTSNAGERGEADSPDKSTNVPTVRSHPPLKASRSMYIVGPSLYREKDDTIEKLRGVSKVPEIERTSTIDEEDSLSSSSDNFDEELPVDEPMQHLYKKEEGCLSQDSESNVQLEKGDGISMADNEAGAELVPETSEGPDANPSSVHICISTIDSPKLESSDPQMSSSLNTMPLHLSGANMLYPGLTKAMPLVSSQTTNRVPSPASLSRPPSPPARSVTPVSPVASTPNLASINELDKSTSQDEDGKFGCAFGETRRQHDYINQTLDEAKRSPLNLDTSVEIHQYKSSLSKVSPLPERRHSAAEAFGQEQRDIADVGFVDVPRGNEILHPAHGVPSCSKTIDMVTSIDNVKNSPTVTMTDSTKWQRRKRLVKRRSDIRSFEKSDGSSVNSDENDNLDDLDENSENRLNFNKRKSKENGKDAEKDHCVHHFNGLKRFVTDFTNESKKKNWMPSLSTRLVERRHKILTQKSVKASGIVLLKETRRKKVKQLSNFFSNVAYTLAPWGKSIRDIEGHHGAGVASYFLFLRWLFGFNIILFLLMVSFIVIPMSLIGDSPLTASTNSIVNTSYYCSLNYTVLEQKGISYLLEFIQGTGWMEKTLAFHGHYVPNLSGSYNLPLAYVLTVLACMIISLGMMARYTSKSFEAALLNSIDTNFEYSNKVFGAWDYGLTDAEAARLKQKGIHYDLQSEMMEQSFMRTRMERMENKCAMFKLYFVRTLINLLIIFMLGAAAYAIVKVTSWSTSYASSHTDASGMDEWVLLLVQYLPSITITACNALLPLLFELVVEFEDYSQAFIIKITLIRTVFLRLASIIVLLITLFTEITCGPTNECRTTVEPGCSDIRCWESYVGQQMYKLVILDFVVAVVKVFAVEIPRKFLAEKCQCGLIQKIGPPEFNITSNVLDLIYAQCLIWLGFLFCPLLPGMMIAKSFILFFVKKLSAMVACPPSEKPYRASRINTFFMIILLLTYFLCAVPVLYGIYGIHPSRGCGPFRLLDYMNEAIENAVEQWPLFLSNSYDLFTSAAFSGTIIILLCMIIYYLNTMSKAHNHRANLLKEQLIMEGRDKQFLLTKLQEQEQKQGKKKTDPSPKRKAGSPRKARASEKQEDLHRRNPRSNDPAEGSFSPPHYVDNPEW